MHLQCSDEKANDMSSSPKKYFTVDPIKRQVNNSNLITIHPVLMSFCDACIMNALTGIRSIPV